MVKLIRILIVTMTLMDSKFKCKIKLYWIDNKLQLNVNSK